MCITRYEDHRYFVACDAVTSAESLVTLILQVLQVPLVPKENILTTLTRALCARPPTLLLLDNFETAWDVNSHGGVLDLLQKIRNAKPVSLIITMRAAVPPAGIRWTQCYNLAPLSPHAAKEVFLAIQSLPSDGNNDGNDGSSLDMLLKDMDYVPLAIRLTGSK